MHHAKYRDLPDIIVCTTDNYENFKYLETEASRIDCYMEQCVEYYTKVKMPTLHRKIVV